MVVDQSYTFINMFLKKADPKTFFILFFCCMDWLLLYFSLFAKSEICCLSDIFSQISDSNGVMMFAKFDQFLREVLKLPTAVFEGPSFGYTEHSVRTCFPQQVWGAYLNHIPTFFLRCIFVQLSNDVHVLFVFMFVCVCIQKKIMLNTFLDVLMADPPPQCLVWLPLMHRLANVENGEIWTLIYF